MGSAQLPGSRTAAAAGTAALTASPHAHPLPSLALRAPAPVFEVVLEETTSGFEHAFHRLETAIRSVLPTLTDPSAKEGGRMTALSRMLPLENALSSLRLRVRRVNAILEQVGRAAAMVAGSANPTPPTLSPRPPPPRSAERALHSAPP